MTQVSVRQSAFTSMNQPSMEEYFYSSQTVDKVHFMDAVYSLFFYNRFMKTNARSDSYDV